jgi:hypothetical protein
MKTLISRMALIAAGVVVLGSAISRFPVPIPPPCRLESPRHVCREVPRPHVRTTTDPPAVR